MKIKNIKYSGQLYCEDDYTFNMPYHVGFYSDKGRRIGEAVGHYINTHQVFYDKEMNDGSNYFIESDCMSQLLCECSDYVLNKISSNKLKKLHNIIFLNRLSLGEGYISKENELKALDLLFEHAEMVIYSFGRTELDDNFPVREDNYWDNYEKILRTSGWKHNKEYDFYVKIREDKWTEDEIRKKLYAPLEEIIVPESEFVFWYWLFSDAKDISMDFALDSFELDGTAFEYFANTKLLSYQYAKEQLSKLEKWKKASFAIEETPVISVSPMFISLALWNLESMVEERKEKSVIFHDDDVEQSMDKILKKYYKYVQRLSKQHAIYEPMLERFYQEQNEFLLRRIHQMALKERQAYMKDRKMF